MNKAQLDYILSVAKEQGHDDVVDMVADLMAADDAGDAAEVSKLTAEILDRTIEIAIDHGITEDTIFDMAEEVTRKKH